MRGKSFIIIGLGRFGSRVAKTLANLNADVLAVDINPDSVREISNDVENCLIADSTKISVLQEIDAANADHVVVAIGNNLQATILTLINLKNLGVKNITVRADEVGHKEIYSRLGATEVIVPEEASAVSLANQMISDSILEYYPLSNDYAMTKIVVGEKFKSATLVELDVRNKFDVNIVGLYSGDDFYIPKGNDRLNPNDVAVVIGTSDKIKKFVAFLKK